MKSTVDCVSGGWRLAALFLVAAAVFAFPPSARIVAEDDARQFDGNLKREFLQRLGDAGDADVKEQIRQLRERNPARGEPRQFQWDGLDGGPRKAKKLRREPAPVIQQIQLKQFQIQPLQAQATMMFVVDNVRVIVETVAVDDDSRDEDDWRDRERPLKQRFRIPQGICEQLVFGSGRNEAEARRRLLDCLRQKIAAVNRICGLTDAQSQKLDLAGRGDIHQYIGRAAQVCLNFEAIHEVDAEDRRSIVSAVVALCRESQPLRNTVEAGPFGEGSLFAKALRRVLTPDQAARYARGE